MKPQWFSVDAKQDNGGIPYDSMWADDGFVAHDSTALHNIDPAEDIGSIFYWRKRLSLAGLILVRVQLGTTVDWMLL
jgi:hypothetical protein